MIANVEGGSAVRVGFGCKVNRKTRRALTSRRWEKKMCRTLSAMLGYQVKSIRCPRRTAC